MTNKERENSLRLKRIKNGLGCNEEPYCQFCQKEKTNPCAKAYNKMIRYRFSCSTEREKYSWGDF